MKILFSSYVFSPSIGGLETVSRLLATEIARAGHELVVITQTEKGDSSLRFPFEVVRRPSPIVLVRLTIWADVVFHNNVSLESAWPLLIVARPWVVAHHTWLPKDRGRGAIKSEVKRLALRRATGIAVSQAVANDFRTPCEVIPNPYDDAIFLRQTEVERRKDLVFVGRLVSDKGLPVLLEALKRLRNQDLAPQLTVVGSGPERATGERLARDLGIAEQVHFAGRKQPDALAAALNRHRIMVVPSLWNEPFGVVALEGIACGCVVVGSQGGGLGEAIGPCGLTFPNGDSDALAECLGRLLTEDDLMVRCRAAATRHLKRHKPARVAAQYLHILHRAKERRNAGVDTD